MRGSFIETPPRTIMEVYKNLPEGTLAELIDKVIYMSPSPLFEHQDILLEIAAQLKSKLPREAGKVIIAPFDIYFDNESNAVQPDITVILTNNPGKLEGQFYGSPDLLIEILSPGNSGYDTVKKKELYERFGVKEYWIVNPETKQTQGFQLQKGKYVSISDKIGKMDSPLLTIALSF